MKKGIFMKRILTLAVAVIALGLFLSFGVHAGPVGPAGPAAAPRNGAWTITSLPVAGQVELGLRYSSERHNMNNSSSMQLSQFQGLTAVQLSNSPAARFALVR